MMRPWHCLACGMLAAFLPGAVAPAHARAEALVYPEPLGRSVSTIPPKKNPGASGASDATAAPIAPALANTRMGGQKAKAVVPAISGTAAANAEAVGVQYAILQGTNKVTARNTRLEAPIGTLVRFGNLEIVAQKCDSSQPPARREQAALLDVWELKSSERPQQIFYGWMFASSPSLSSLSHPVYDLSLLECTRHGDGEPASDSVEMPAAEPARKTKR